jgi:Holliday junction DNA helicase RuvA
MVLPINRIAEAIREQNIRLVDSLPGISPAGAEKIVATLRQKMATFEALEDVERPRVADSRDELEGLAVALLVEMGIKRPDAARSVARLLKEKPELTSVEDLVMEYFRK